MRVESFHHFIVQVAIRREPNDPSLRARWEWLSVESDYPSHTSTKERAHRIKAPPTAEDIAGWSGMPWHCKPVRRFKPRIFRVTETRTEELVKP